MKRQDLYILALSGLQFFYFVHTMFVVNAGAGITLMGEKGFFGYFTIALFVLLFGLIFNNVGKLVAAIGKDEEESLREIMKIGRWSVLALLTLTALQFLNALSLYAQYSA